MTESQWRKERLAQLKEEEQKWRQEQEEKLNKKQQEWKAKKLNEINEAQLNGLKEDRLAKFNRKQQAWKEDQLAKLHERHQQWGAEQLAKLDEEHLARLNENQQDLARNFSELIEWTNDGKPKFRPNTKLLRQVLSALEQFKDIDNQESFANFWYENWKNSTDNYTIKDFKKKYRDNHPLDAYIHQICLKISKKLLDKYKQHPSFKNFETRDYFHLAYLRLDEILNEYNRELNPNLAAYAAKKIKDRIVDELRNINSRSGNSKEYLLLTANPRRLTKALRKYGVVSSKLIEDYLLVWDYYKEINLERKSKKEKKYSEPDQRTLRDIVRAVNLEYPQLLRDTEQLSEWMNECSLALINYSNIKTVSIYTPIPKGNGRTYLDLFAEEKESSNDNIETIETNERSSQLIAQFTNQLTIELDKIFAEEEQQEREGKKRRLLKYFNVILDLHYGLGMKQAEIAAYMNCFYYKENTTDKTKTSQSTVSRKISRIISGEDMLGDRLLLWINNNPEYPVHLENPKKIAVFINSIKDVLKYNYYSLEWKGYTWLDEEIGKLSPFQQELIEIYYGRYLAEENIIDRISDDFSQDANQVQKSIQEIKSLLANNFAIFAISKLNINWSQENLNLSEYLKDADKSKFNNITLEVITLEILERLLKNYCQKVRIKVESELRLYQMPLPDLSAINEWLSNNIDDLEASKKDVLTAWYCSGSYISSKLVTVADIESLSSAKKELTSKFIKYSKTFGVNLRLYEFALKNLNPEKEQKKLEEKQRWKASRYLDRFLSDYFANL